MLEGRNTDLLSSLVVDIKREVLLEFLGAGSIINLSNTNKTFHSFFQSERALANAVFKILLDLVTRGKRDAAEEVLKLYPDLLACVAAVQHLDRPKFVKRTLYQIALANVDHNMCFMMEKYFAELSNGKDIRMKQFRELFPEDKIVSICRGTNEDHEQKRRRLK